MGKASEIIADIKALLNPVSIEDIKCPNPPPPPPLPPSVKGRWFNIYRNLADSETNSNCFLPIHFL